MSDYRAPRGNRVAARANSTLASSKVSANPSAASKKAIILPNIDPNGKKSTSNNKTVARSTAAQKIQKPSSQATAPAQAPHTTNETSGGRKAATQAQANFGGAKFAATDRNLFENSFFQHISRVIQTCAAQSSCNQLIHAIEELSPSLLVSDGKSPSGDKQKAFAPKVRVLIVHKGKFFTVSRPDDPLDVHVGFAGHVNRKREIVNLTYPARESMFNRDVDQLGNTPSDALLCVPVLAAHPATGIKEIVAVIQAFGNHSFSTSDCVTLYRFGGFMGSLIRNNLKADSLKSLYNASLETHKKNVSLLGVSKTLAQETKQDAVISVIVSRVPELLDCDRCTVFLLDSSREHLVVRRGASSGRRKNLVSWIFGQCNAPELPFPEGSDEIHFPINAGVAGYVATRVKLVNIVDAHLDPRFDNSMDKKTGYRTRSILCLPMTDNEGNAVGVVQAINKNPLYAEGFGREDETLLKSFSAQAALAVRNSMLFEKTQRALKESNALLNITVALSQEMKLGRLMNMICEKVQDLLQSERCTCFLVSRERKQLYTSAQMTHGMGAPLKIDEDKSSYVYFPMDRGIAGSVATTGDVVNIKDAYQDPRFNKSYDVQTGFRTRSILCMVIKGNRSGDNVGVLQCINKKKLPGQHDRFFSSYDEKLLGAFCSQASVAIETNLLFLETERALNHALADQRNLKFMLSVTKNMFSEMHLMSLIDQLTMQVHHLLKADHCALYLVDLSLNKFYHAKEENATRYGMNVGIVGHVAQTGEIVRISTQANKHERFDARVDQRLNKTTHSILCCPIKVEANTAPGKRDTEEEEAPQYKAGTIIGVICVCDEQDRGGFEKEEESLLQVFCAQAAVAIVNSQNFNKLMDNTQDFKKADHSAAEYLKKNRGMQLLTEDVNRFFFKMSELDMKGTIGSGSYGEVYKAHLKNQVVAVKRLHVHNLKAEQLDAFCSEASLMCQLDHKNIVRFVGAVTEPSNLCIITEYCAKGSLADLLMRKDVKMDFALKLRVMLEAATGMYYLHTSNPLILHRDLKSDNLLISADWTTKVADFGLTRFLSKKVMTQVGTPMWMAPEIILGRKYTEKADVYAFGIIMWEILTRAEPYENKEPMQIVLEVVNDNLRPTLNDRLRKSPGFRLMTDCWHVDPVERPTFKAVVERLERLAALHAEALKTNVKLDYDLGFAT